jgi:hypothetical protein
LFCVNSGECSTVHFRLPAQSKMSGPGPARFKKNFKIFFSKNCDFSAYFST